MNVSLVPQLYNVLGEPDSALKLSYSQGTILIHSDLSSMSWGIAQHSFSHLFEFHSFFFLAMGNWALVQE